MKRIFLFLATNLAVIVLLGIILRLIGFEGILDERGVDLNLGALLVFAAVVGFTGSFISLAMSKWSAKRAMGAGHRPALEPGRALARRYGAPAGATRRHRHAGSRRLRLARAERVCDGRAA